MAKIGTESLSEARRRIEHQYKEEIAILGAGSYSADAFRDTVLAFETAANLGQRDYMRIYGIAVSEELLAGAELSAFLGFFDQRYRDHDYDRGRMVARGVLTDPRAERTGGAGADTVLADADERYRHELERAVAESAVDRGAKGVSRWGEETGERDGAGPDWILVLSGGRGGDRSADECDPESFVSGVGVGGLSK